MKLSQENRDKIRAYAKVFAWVFIGITFVLCVSVEVLKQWEDAEWYNMVAYVLGYMCDTCAVLSLIFVIAMLLANQRNQEDIMRDKVEDPLKDDLTPEQRTEIIEMMKLVGRPLEEGSNKINRAAVATFLVTLRNLGALKIPNDTTWNNYLRLWVEKETGYRESDSIHFNEAIERVKKGPTKYTKDVKKILGISD